MSQLCKQRVRGRLGAEGLQSLVEKQNTEGKS